MAKSLSKSSGARSRKSSPAKSAKAAARPSAKTAVKKLPARSRPSATRSAPAKSTPAKAPARKMPPAKPVSSRSRAATADKSPATEEEIISAVAGKLTSRTGGGMTWLSAKAARIETVEISMEQPAPEPEPVIPVEAVVVEEEPVAEAAAPRGTDAAAESSPSAGTAAGSSPAAEAAPAPAEERTEAPVPEATVAAPDISAEVPPVSVVTEAVADAAAAVDTAPAAPDIPAATSPAAKASPHAAPPSGDLLLAVFSAARQQGRALTVQALTFIAFCILVKGGVPASGLPWVLAAVIPVFAIFLAVTAWISFCGTTRLLDQLDPNRARSDPAHPPASLTPARLLAHQPALIILGCLIVVWFLIGATVWWL